MNINTQKTNYTISNNLKLFLKTSSKVSKSKTNLTKKIIRKSSSYIYNKSNKENITYNNYPKLFSLIDINDKITNSKGTSLPIQYKRFTEEEMNKKILINYKKGRSYGKDLINKIKEKSNKYYNEKSNSEREYKTNLKINIHNSNEEKIKKIDKEKRNPSMNLSEYKLNIKSMNNKSKFNIFKKPSKMLTSNSNQNPKKFQMKIRKDKYLPKNYSTYELLVKNPELINKTQNSNVPHLIKNFSQKEIREKFVETDIFFQKTTKKTEDDFSKKVSNYPNFQNSDIFNIKNDKTSINKSGEKYLFNKNKITFNSNFESKSEWDLKNIKPTLLNHSSKNYNILNPSTKSFSKEEISEKKNNNDFHKQKVFSEYYDLTRIYAPNINKEYVKTFNESNDIFKKKNNLCESYFNIHHMYKDLCSKPFIKSN